MYLFRALSCKVKEVAEMGKKLVCSLMVDETTIREELVWDGFIDIGLKKHFFPNKISLKLMVIMMMRII